jgi:hypothetical protein
MNKTTMSYQIRCRWQKTVNPREDTLWRPIYPNTKYYFTDSEESRQRALRRAETRLANCGKEELLKFDLVIEYKIVKVTQIETEEDL